MSNSQPQPTIRLANMKLTNQGPAVFAPFYKDETLVDVTLSCIQSNHQINAHRLVLAACSPYFRNMFEKQSNPLYPIVNIDNIYVEDLRLVLEFMYKGEVMIPDERLANVARCATILEVDGWPTDPRGMV